MPPTRIAAYASNVGTGISGQTTNNGRVFIALKPWDQRKGGSIQEYITRNGRNCQSRGGQFFMQATPDVRVGARISKTEYRTPAGCGLRRTYFLGTEVLQRLQSLPMLRDVTTDRQTGGTTATMVIDRNQAARFASSHR